MSFLIKLKIVYLKIDVSCQASVHFHHISQNATPATEFARCHHLTQPRQCDLQRTRSTTRLKCCACRLPRKRTMEVSQKCNSSSENEKYCAKRDVERTHPQPPDPQSETGTLATHSEKTPRLKQSWDTFFLAFDICTGSNEPPPP